MRFAPPPVRVLATGFGPFPGIPRNASALLVQSLAQCPALPGIQLSTEIFPVAWTEAKAVSEEAISKHKPHAILHFGVAKRATGFEIETRAFNISNVKEDHGGVVRPPVALIPSGMHILRATLPPFALLGALKRSGYPALLSRDAGRYLCNATLYWSLARANTAGPLVTFVHLPALGTPTEVKPRLTMDETIAGARVLIRTSAEAVLRAMREKSGQLKGSNGHGSQALYGNRRGGNRLVWNSAS